MLFRSETVSFFLRPEALRVIAQGDAAPPDWARLSATITRVELLGALIRLETRLADGAMLRVALLDEPGSALAVGRAVELAYDPVRVTQLGAA